MKLVDNFALPRSFSFLLLYVSLPNALVLADCTFLPLLKGFHLDANGTLLVLILGLDEEAIGKSSSWVTLWKLTLVPKRDTETFAAVSGERKENKKTNKQTNKKKKRAATKGVFFFLD